MTENIFEQVQGMIHNARRINGRNPDYIVIGRLTLKELMAFNNDNLTKCVDYYKENECKCCGIDVVESFKEHELNVAYKMEG